MWRCEQQCLKEGYFVMWHYNYLSKPHFGGWGIVISGLLNLLFWGVLIVLIIWIIVKVNKNNTSITKQTPINFAAERYAKGEITKEQFEQIKKDLKE